MAGSQSNVAVYDNSMKLHRSSNRPEWLRYPRRRWSVWQRLAGRSHGILTLGNAFTVVGLLLVLGGLAVVANGRIVMGLSLAILGRLCDLLDGYAADKTHTKSPLGEKLDAGVDKLETLAAVAVLVIVDLVPLWAALALLMSQLCIAAVSLRSARLGARLHPERLGKLNMALVWLILAGFVLHSLVAASIARDGLGAVLFVLTGLSVVTSLRITWRYAKLKSND